MHKINKSVDARRLFLKDLLQKDGYPVIFLEDYLKQVPPASSKCIVLLPLPVNKEQLQTLLSITPGTHLFIGGKLLKDFKKICQAKRIPCIDYMDSLALAEENAIATAEGAICEAIKNSVINLHGADCLVIGFGVCGKILADKLYGMKCNVFISTRNPEARAHAFALGYSMHHSFSSYQFIFNTAPALVLNQEVLKQLSVDCLIIDIATKPGGTDFAYCQEKGIQAHLCPGLPGKYAPKTSASFIYRHIQNVIREFHMY